MPCGNTIKPLPKLRTSVPEASNFSTVSRSDPRQVFAPQRSATQIDRPSRSISTALVEPQVRPAGILKKFSTVRYGFGASLTGVTVCCANVNVTAHNAIAPTIPSRLAPDIPSLPVCR
jgi:hypothetical protein